MQKNNHNNHKKAVILFSGGLDSATILAIANDMGYNNYLLSFNYSQNHQIELDFASKFINKYRNKFNILESKIANIDLSIFNSSSLLNKSIPIEKNRHNIIEEITNKRSLSPSCPSTYVPARNTIFLSYAFGYAENINAEAIFIGVNAIDYSGYPDCRPQFINAFNDLVRNATKNSDMPIKVMAPLLSLSKSEIIKKGLELDVDYNLTYSCYDPVIIDSKFVKICEVCDSCIIRENAFKQINVSDQIFK